MSKNKKSKLVMNAIKIGEIRIEKMNGEAVFYRKCPKCSCDVKHKNTKSLHHSFKNEKHCIKCTQNRPEFKERISECQRGENNSFYGKKHSSDNLKLYSKLASGENNPMYGIGGMAGKTHSDETKNKQSIARSKYWDLHGIKGRTQFGEYRRLVDNLTRKQPIQLLEHFEKRGVAGKDGAYHLDHVISVYDGYHTGMDANEISNISNLRFIPWLENQRKWKNSL